MLSAICFNLVKSKILASGNGLIVTVTRAINKGHEYSPIAPCQEIAPCYREST